MLRETVTLLSLATLLAPLSYVNNFPDADECVAILIEVGNTIDCNIKSSEY